MLLQNKIALVTGGARGIGKGIALKFAEEGCNVAITDINIDVGNKTISEINETNHDGLAIQCDVMDSRQVDEAVSAVLEKFGRIDILVNNVGGCRRLQPSKK